MLKTYSPLAVLTEMRTRLYFSICSWKLARSCKQLLLCYNTLENVLYCRAILANFLFYYNSTG
jgi:hypothetical protein